MRILLWLSLLVGDNCCTSTVTEISGLSQFHVHKSGLKFEIRCHKTFHDLAVCSLWWAVSRVCVCCARCQFAKWYDSILSTPFIILKKKWSRWLLPLYSDIHILCRYWHVYMSLWKCDVSLSPVCCWWWILFYFSLLFMICCATVRRILTCEVSTSLPTFYIVNCWSWSTLTGQAETVKTLVAGFTSCRDLLATYQVCLCNFVLCFVLLSFVVNVVYYCTKAGGVMWLFVLSVCLSVYAVSRITDECRNRRRPNMVGMGNGWPFRTD